MQQQLLTTLALGALTLSTACVDEVAPGDDVAAPSDDDGEITPLSGARADLFGAFEVGKSWPKDYLTVCWMPEIASSTKPDVKTLRDAGRAAVLREWGRVSRMRIGSSWSSCATNPSADIRIGMVTDEGVLGRSQIGTNALSVPAGQPTMILQFDLSVAGSCAGGVGNACNRGTPESLDADDIPLFEHIILHEFGHALGLRHEHARADATCNASGETLDLPGYDGEPLWSYDATSVMNYCATTGKLSPGDLRAINTLYPGVVGLFSGNDLVTGTSVTSQPKWLGPGYYTSTQVPEIATTSSIVVPPGFRARGCTPSRCAYFDGSERTLISLFNDKLVNLEVAPWVIGADGVGFDGTSERFGVGPRAASSFQTLGDNTMSSVYVPPTRAATVCADASGGGSCFGPIVGGGAPYGVKLPTGVNNQVSYVSVSPRVVTYDGAFTGTSYALSTGTYKASTNAPWLTSVGSLAISGLDVRACTEEGVSSPIPGSGGAGTCWTLTQSTTLWSLGNPVIRFLSITTPLVNGGY